MKNFLIIVSSKIMFEMLSAAQRKKIITFPISTINGKNSSALFSIQLLNEQIFRVSRLSGDPKRHSLTYAHTYILTRNRNW